jgi:hypothetical protein
MFVPQDCGFVFAIIEGIDKNEKIKLLTDWLEYWLKFKSLCRENGSVIFDIDDTLVNKKEEQIPRMIDIYKLCVKLDFVVNIITARPETKNNREATMRMLHSNGITQFEALYMMPNDIQPTFKTISHFKYNARAHVAKRHQILANCGDMWSDHYKYPTVKVLNERTRSECGICFIPGEQFPCCKLPCANDDE